jgi:hypothetical protein
MKLLGSFLLLLSFNLAHADERPMLALSIEDLQVSPYEDPLYAYGCQEDFSETHFLFNLRQKVQRAIQVNADRFCQKDGSSGAATFTTEVIMQSPAEVLGIGQNLKVTEEKAQYLIRNKDGHFLPSIKPYACPQSEFNPRIFTSLTCK